ncbi:hypothetical protein [Brevibacterium picturae]|uniref:Uncharacterized protein n=1 Tax=Brevibacterium picturae TaxID=260553 RepID=A0ABN2CEL9_9MICO
MYGRTMSTLGAAAAVATALVLAGCSNTTPTPNDSTAGGTAAQFIACLSTAGIEAKIGDQGHVLVKVASDSTDGGFSIGSGSGSGGESPLLMTGDTEGNTWVAAASSAYFADDPDTQDAYAGCESQFPDFAQPEYDPQNDPDTQDYFAQQAEDGLEFARCARDAGFAWVADPAGEAGTSQAITLPADVTEDEFRALLEACLTPELNLAWAVPADLAFDWTAVLDEFSNVVSGSGSASYNVGSGDDE